MNRTRATTIHVVVLAITLAACSTSASTTVADVAISETTSPPATTQPSTSASTTSVPAATTTEAPTTSTTPEPGIPEIVVSGGSVSGPDRIEVALGTLVEFVVVADVEDEVHVHGYDVFAEVGPETPAEFSFTADIPGIFEVELESSHAVLVELVVQ